MTLLDIKLLINGFEAHLIKLGLESVSAEMKKEIQEAEKLGRNHIMTEGFVDMTINELLKKIDHLTIKKMKNKTTAMLLTLLGLLGIAGLQYLYLGKPLKFVLWLLTLGIFGIGTLIDIFTISGSVDSYNTQVQLKIIVKKNQNEC